MKLNNPLPQVYAVFARPPAALMMESGSGIVEEAWIEVEDVG